MSTKTSIKRIALVAVSALGFGLMTSVAPANATLGTPTIAQSAFVVRADDATYRVAPGVGSGTDANIAITEGATGVFNGEFLRVNYQSTAAATPIRLSVADIAAGATATLTGNVTLTLGANISFTASTEALASSTAASSVTLAVGRGAVPGIYTLILDDANTFASAGAENITRSITVTGAPSSIRIVGDTGTSTRFATADGNSDYTVSVRDSSLRDTYLLATESIALTENGVGLAVTLPLVQAITSGELNATGSAARSTTARLAVSSGLTSGTYTLTATPNAALTALGVVAATGTLTLTRLASGVPSTELVMTSPTTQTSAEAGVVNSVSLSERTSTAAATSPFNATAQTVYSNTTNTTFTFRIYAAAAATGSATYTIAASNLVVSPVAGTYAVALTQDALGSYADVTVRVSSITANAGTFSITSFTDGTNDPQITVDFRAPVAAAIDFSAPTDTTTIASAFGGSTTLTALVTDQYRNPMANQALVFNRPASRNTARAETVVTGANGTASATFADTSTSTLAGSDAIYVGTSALTSDPGVMGDLITIFYATNVTPAAVTRVTANTSTSEVLADGSTRVTIDATNTSATVTDEFSLQVRVTNSAGSPIQGSAVVFSTNNGYVKASTGEVVVGSLGVTSVTVFTDASGLATAHAAATKVGSATLTATAGSVSTSVSVTARNAATTTNIGRNVAVSSSGNLVSATVTDGWGNPLAGFSVTLTASNGTFLTGSNTVTSTTNTDGVATAALAAGTGITVTATIGGTQSVVTAGGALATPVDIWAVAVPTATTAAFAVEDSGQSASDAAAEAIDAANAATDAANLAAEAADAATVAAEEARDAADAATAAVEELATQVATLFATLRAQITTLANTVAKIAKRVRA